MLKNMKNQAWLKVESDAKLIKFIATKNNNQLLFHPFQQATNIINWNYNLKKHDKHTKYIAIRLLQAKMKQKITKKRQKTVNNWTFIKCNK